MSAAIQEPIPLTPSSLLPQGERGDKSEGWLARVVVTVHSLIRRFESRWLVATGLTAAAALALAPLMSERPWLLTILFATLTLRAIVELREQRPPWWVWALPVVYVLWANVHVQFV